MQPAYLAQLVNRSILKALRKYEVNNWIFIILETCQASVVLEREQYWLDILEPEYNLSKVAGSTLGVALCEEAKAKLRLVHIGKTHSLSFYSFPQLPRQRLIKSCDSSNSINSPCL